MFLMHTLVEDFGKVLHRERVIEHFEHVEMKNCYNFNVRGMKLKSLHVK